MHFPHSSVSPSRPQSKGQNCHSGGGVLLILCFYCLAMLGNRSVSRFKSCDCRAAGEGGDEEHASPPRGVHAGPDLFLPPSSFFFWLLLLVLTAWKRKKAGDLSLLSQALPAYCFSKTWLITGMNPLLFFFFSFHFLKDIYPFQTFIYFNVTLGLGQRIFNRLFNIEHHKVCQRCFVLQVFIQGSLDRF